MDIQQLSPGQIHRCACGKELALSLADGNIWRWVQWFSFYNGTVERETVTECPHCGRALPTLPEPVIAQPEPVITQPDAATLQEWRERWLTRKKAAYRALIASYTPEQRRLAAEAGHAASQAKCCAERLKWPEGATGKRATLVAWPENPDRVQP